MGQESIVQGDIFKEIADIDVAPLFDGCSLSWVFLICYSISKSRWKREGKRAATRQYNEYGEAPHSVADKVNA
jgi:hypothetical protein